MIDNAEGPLTGGGLQKVLELARRHLDMDLAFLAEFTDGQQVYRGLAGEAESFGWAVDDALPLPETYCRLMVEGSIPNAVAETSALPALRELEVTADAGIGSYVGVAVRLADGSLYGSLCALSHDARQVDDKDAKFLGMLAELVATEVQTERDQEAARSHVRQLIRHEQIAIALQPIVDIVTGRVLGVEALSRFPSDGRSPDKVFAAAHDVGLGMELERLATRHALELLALLGRETYLAVNLTPSVAIELAALAHQTDLPLDRVVLEMTEHAAVENYAVLRDSLEGIRRRGVRVAIDDAGAGYASLHHIVELGPDVIKIDRSLIDGISRHPARRSVVKAFVALAADLEASLVGEGVEDPADVGCARALGIHAVQGYLFARPSTDRQELARWLEAGFGMEHPQPGPPHQRRARHSST